MTLAILLLIIAFLHVVVFIFNIVRPTLDPATRLIVVLLGLFMIVVQVLAALALM